MRDIVAALQSNVIGIILMVITLFSLTKNRRSGVLADKLFFMLVVSIMAVCVSEIFGTAFNTLTFAGARTLNRIMNALLFMLNPVPAFLWALYANCKIYKSEDKLRRAARLLALPLLLVVVMSAANLFTDVFFTITSDNVYARTDFFFIATVLSALYLVYVAVIVLVNRKRIGRDLSVPILCFMIPPIIGLTLQFCFYGMYMLWVSVSTAVIIIFNHVQNDYAITDWLTGVYNRKHLDNYLQQMCRRKRSDLIVGFMLDIDSFKLINDSYGHLMGDRALKETASVLKSALGNKAYVARYAGDEFVVILQARDASQIPPAYDAIHHAISAFNASSSNPYTLSLSVGHAVFKGQGEETEDEFLSRVDSSMYRAKNKD